MSTVDRVLPEFMVLPPRTVCRRGCLTEVLRECIEYGSSGLLVYGKSLERSGALKRILDGVPEGMCLETWQRREGEPCLDELQKLVEKAREANIAWVAAVGGGSAMDLGKACAGLLHATLPVAEYHRGAEMPASHVPFVAAPTTAGTGAEATTVSVLTDSERGIKKSIRHSSFMAKKVFLDAEVLDQCPPEVVAGAGMDALTQGIEAYLSRHATWVTDAMSKKSISLVSDVLERVYRGERGDAAELLLIGSYLAGIALSNARLGVVHGLAHPLGSRYDVPHGMTCGVCLPFALEFNREAAERKYGKLCRIFGGDAVDTVRSLLVALNIVSPFAGKNILDKERIIEETLASGSTAANPRSVTKEDVEHLLSRIFNEVPDG